MQYQPNDNLFNVGSRPRRRGFSLVEVLIVIAILGILTALVLGAYGSLVGGARIVATQTTLEQIHEAIDAKFRGLLEEDFDSEVNALVILYNRNNGSPDLPQSVAKTIVLSDQYKMALPQRREDLFGLNGVVDDPPGSVDDSPLLAEMWDSVNGEWLPGSWVVTNNYGTVPSGNAIVGGRADASQLRAESSELLHLALSQGRTFGAETFDMGNININHIGDTDGDGNPEFVDDWGRPIQFYNAPTRLIRPNGTDLDIAAANALIAGLPAPSTALDNPLNQDPFDPSGFAEKFFRDTLLPPDDLNIGSSTPEVKRYGEEFHRTPGTMAVFLLVSMGPDGEPGMGIPTSTASRAAQLGQPFDNDTGTAGFQVTPELTDNVTNRQQ